MTVTIPYEYDKKDCLSRLPCGICRLTMTICPLKPIDTTPKIETSPITIISGNGTTGEICNETDRCR